MTSIEGMKKVSYLCVTCSQTINFGMDAEVHLARQELKINGLASYIDVHPDKEGKDHGIKMFIDPNFHVRTNHKLEPKSAQKKKSLVPMPGFKTTNLNTKYPWKTWAKLELSLNTENIKFFLELDREASTEEHTIKSEIQTTSTLGLVDCKVDAIVGENEFQSFEFIATWMQSLCNSLELAAAIHVDLIPEVLRYIDTHVYRQITKMDETIIAILIDKASILIPNLETFGMLDKFGPGLNLIEVCTG